MEKVYAPGPDASRRLSGKCMQSSSGNLIELPLPPRLVGNLLDRREEIRQHTLPVLGELDTDQHAREELRTN